MPPYLHPPDRPIQMLLEEIHRKGLRRTPALKSLVSVLFGQRRPLTLKEICLLPGLENPHQVTIYRLIVKLEELRFVRRRSVQGRAQVFQLRWPRGQSGLLVCRHCGGIHELESVEELREAERLLEDRTGWGELHLESELTGYCPDCAKPRPST